MEPDSCWGCTVTGQKTTVQVPAYLQHEHGQILEQGSRESVGSPSMEVLQDGLDKAPNNLI